MHLKWKQKIVQSNNVGSRLNNWMFWQHAYEISTYSDKMDSTDSARVVVGRPRFVRPPSTLVTSCWDFRRWTSAGLPSSSEWAVDDWQASERCPNLNSNRPIRLSETRRQCLVKSSRKALTSTLTCLLSSVSGCTGPASTASSPISFTFNSFPSTQK